LDDGHHHDGALYVVPNRKRQNYEENTFLEFEFRKYQRKLIRGKVALENQRAQLKAAVALSVLCHDLKKLMRPLLDSEMVKVYLEDPEVGDDDLTRRLIRSLQKVYKEVVCG
jgi:hypothetical protein